MTTNHPINLEGLPKAAQIYASEYKLYLPSKEELRQKLVEWAEEVEG